MGGARRTGAHLDGEEHGAELCQPLRLDGSHALHVLLAGEDELVVHDVVGRVPQAVQGGGGMEVTRDGGAAVDVLPDAPHLGSIVEVGGADGLADHVPVGSRGRDRQLLLLHDVHQLRPDLLRLAHACKHAWLRLKHVFEYQIEDEC